MTDQDSTENWQLQEGDKSDDRWVLRESEQRLSDQWDLQTPQTPVQEWQPVEYVKQPRSGLTWILPSVVVIALLAVLAYTAWTVIPGLVMGGTATPVTDQPTLIAGAPSPQASAVSTQTTPVGAVAGTPVSGSIGVVTETVAPSTPTVAPSPSPSTVEQEVAQVVSTYGVNARNAANTDANVITVLPQNAKYLVLAREANEWLKLYIGDGTVSPTQAITGEIGYAAAEYFNIAPQEFPAEFITSVLRSTGNLPTPIVPTPATLTTQATPVTGSVPALTSTTPAVTGTAPTESTPGPTPISASATISPPGGLNIREGPSLNSQIVELAPQNTAVTVLGRTTDNQWLRVQLPDGALGWGFLTYLNFSGNVENLPIIAASTPEPVSLPTLTPTAAATPTAPTGPKQPPAPFTNELPANAPAVVVTFLEGVNARASASTDAKVIIVVPQNAALRAVGRSADNQWVEVTLPDGQMAWVFRNTVQTVGAIDALPIGGPGQTPAASAATPPVVVTPPAAGAVATTAAVITPTTTTPIIQPTPTPTQPTGPTATVNDILVAVYPAPTTAQSSIAALSRGTVLSATGRSANNDWIQVRSPDGSVGWVSAASVQLSVSVDTLPVAQ